MRNFFLGWLLVGTLSWCSAAALDAPDPPSIDHVVVYKQQRKMVLLSRDKEVKTYQVSLGTEPVGPKRRQGDHRTPEGSYILDVKNSHSHYYKAFHISYPNSADLASAKKLGVKPGGDIMLHGLPNGFSWVGKTQRLEDWTDGCIAVTNDEMDELWNLVAVGTPIEIRP
jgi:murein L,D-transpeptidase YafK